MYDNFPPNFMATSSQDFPMSGYDVQNTRFNSTERILSPSNVSRLVPYWSVDADILPSTVSSPTIVNGIVYVYTDEGKLYAFQPSTVQVPTAQPFWTTSAFQPSTVQVPTLQPLWTASIKKPRTNTDLPSPTVVNGVVYIGSHKGILYALNATTGQTLWTAPTDDDKDWSPSPTVANGVVYVGSLNNKVYAFHAATGQTLWTAPTTHGIKASPAVANGVVYIASGETLYGFNATTGKCLWTASPDDPILSSPVVANDVVYVVSSLYGKLYAFHAFKHKFLGMAAIGKTLWTASTDGYTSSSPAVANGVVYVATYDKGGEDGKLHAFNAATGQTLWTASADYGFFRSPTVANGVVYISDVGKLYAFHATTGQTLWTSPTNSEGEGSDLYSPAVANGVVYTLCPIPHILVAFHLG